MPTNRCQKPSKATLPNLHAIAKRVRLVIRYSKKFCPEVLLLSLIQLSLNGKESLREIASLFKGFLPGISKQAMFKRIGPKFTGPYLLR